jgi:hypothetical protein
MWQVGRPSKFGIYWRYFPNLNVVDLSRWGTDPNKDALYWSVPVQAPPNPPADLIDKEKKRQARVEKNRK